jgi:hypothetical protein
MRYKELSEEFQNIGEMFLLFLKQKEENSVFDEFIDVKTGKKTKKYLKERISILRRILESKEGWNLLKKIYTESSDLSKRCAWFCDEIVELPNKYDYPESANRLTKRNIFEIKSVLDSHELNKQSKVYDGMIELRNIQNALGLYIQVAKQLNYYLKKQNEKTIQIEHGKLLLIYLDNGELNSNYIE